MKRLVATALGVVVVLGIIPSRCFALMGIKPVSKDEAKEMGIVIRLTDSGPKDCWVELEFKPEGKLKDYSHVSLEIRDGDKLLVGYAPLQEKRTDSGSVVVRFLADRAYLDKITLSVVAGFPTNRTGYELRVKDFVEPEKDR
ncbi:MAG TPA: hypothetical protein VMS17_00910 [Gemmataceae bacterium]|nr:hypothetical protein [Gemmataceae bacterium]